MNSKIIVAGLGIATLLFGFAWSARTPTLAQSTPTGVAADCMRVVSVDPQHLSTLLTLSDESCAQRVHLQADVGGFSKLWFTGQDQTKERIALTASASGGNALVELNDPIGNTTIRLSANDGTIALNDPLGKTTIRLSANDGTITTRIIDITGGADLAEPFPIVECAAAEHTDVCGMLLSIDRERPGMLRLSRRPYDSAVIGVVSGANGLQPGIVLRGASVAVDDAERNVALTGRVWTWCDASFGKIHPGDALTTSSTPGHCMHASSAAPSGTRIGKAMSSLHTGRGLVLIVIQPH